MHRIVAHGIIPAYAGSTLSVLLGIARQMGSSPHTRGAQRARGWMQRPQGDHPRIRGEHFSCLVHPCLSIGIIPAYAGSTKQNYTMLDNLKGSPPHTRGAPV